MGQDCGCMSISPRLSPEATFRDSPWFSGTLSSRHLPALVLLSPRPRRHGSPQGPWLGVQTWLRMLRALLSVSGLGLTPLLSLLGLSLVHSSHRLLVTLRSPHHFSRDNVSSLHEVPLSTSQSGVLLGRQSSRSAGQTAHKVWVKSSPQSLRTKG